MPKLYHYLITIQAPNAPIGVKIGSFSGTMERLDTVQEAMDDRFRYACNRLGSDPENSYIICWSFEPNDL